MITADMSVFASIARDYDALALTDNDQITSGFSGIHLPAIAWPPGLPHPDSALPPAWTPVDITVLTVPPMIGGLHLTPLDGYSLVQSIISDLPDYAASIAVDAAMNLIRAHVIDTTLSDLVIEEFLSNAVMDEAVNPLSPISILGWLIGLPF